MPRQLFVLKQKDVAFTKPTLELEVDDVVLTKWKYQSFPLNQWREKCQHVRSIAESGVDVNETEIKLEETKVAAALEFKTPNKSRIRETLEDNDSDTYSTINVTNDLSSSVMRRHL